MPDDIVETRLTAARVGDNLTLTLDVDTYVHGPCQRCLADADVAVQTRGIEYVRHGDSGATGEDEDEEAYVVAHQIDLERWVRDLIAEALPRQAALPRRLPRPVPGLRRRPQRRSRTTGTRKRERAAVWYSAVSG